MRQNEKNRHKNRPCKRAFKDSWFGFLTGPMLYSSYYKRQIIEAVYMSCLADLYTVALKLT